ncbi:MAG: hypothetical protein M1541_06915, partial [Acidobacteria bacterium]|nr:hypothetical protein [Acidobacteriota bacterium]
MRNAVAAFALAAAFAFASSGQEHTKSGVEAYRAKLLSVASRHLDLLLNENGGKLPALRTKAADSMTALAYYLAYEMTGKERYRAAANELADRIVKHMRASRLGVLYIKEKEKAGGKTIPGGGPPSFAWYIAAVGYIYHKEGGHDADLKYIATVLDNFPWNEEGWWSADIDVNTGISKQPLDHPSPINKNAAMALASAMLSEYIRDLDATMSARLKHKADKCIYSQIIPAQQPDGYWHYGLTGRDPANKDILGYFMITADVFIQLQHFTGSYKDAVFNRALEKASDFALDCIAPMTDPNHGPACRRSTPSTPAHFSLQDDPRRGFELALVLTGTGALQEGMKITDAATRYFPYGHTGAEGAHAVRPAVLMAFLLSQKPASGSQLAHGPESDSISRMERMCMRDLNRKVFLLAVAACLLAARVEAKPNLSGTWKLNVTKSDFGPLPAPSARTDKIEHSDPNQ